LATSLSAAILLIFVLIIALKNPAYGLAILLAELIIGSQGYLLWLGEEESRLSLRIALWIVVMAVWFVRQKNLFAELKVWTYRRPFFSLVALLVLAALVGFMFNNETALIFTEAKRWLYLAALIPLSLVFKDKASRELLWPIIGAALLWIALKTLLTVYLFSHGFAVIEIFYEWTRFNLLGEITPLANGFYRVFLQSQVFAIPAFFFSLALFIRKHKTLDALAAALFLAVILTSLSRSFWVGTLAGLIIMSLSALIKFRPKLKSIIQALGSSAIVAVAGILILFAIVRFPFPEPTSQINAALFKDRATGFEAAAASRWALLPVMGEALKNNPLLGYGLGKELTYKTSDPRVLQNNPNGLYTTNAFEWGWLDIWLKLGLLGLAVYIWFLVALAKTQDQVGLGALAALAILHIFTPYLNHPLGFGYLALAIVGITMYTKS
jgi:O-antigen ligase